MEYQGKSYKAVVFDVDSTLTVTKSGGTFRKTADDWQWMPGRLERCQHIAAGGTLTAMASNQGGVCFAWSTISEVEMERVFAEMCEQMQASTWRACYSIPNEKALPEYYNPNDPRRKPNPGMLLEIKGELGIEPEEMLYVGDRAEDQGAALAAGCGFAWADDFFGEEQK